MLLQVFLEISSSENRVSVVPFRWGLNKLPRGQMWVPRVRSRCVRI